MLLTLANERENLVQENWSKLEYLENHELIYCWKFLEFLSEAHVAN